MTKTRRVTIAYYNQEYSIACNECQFWYKCDNGLKCTLERHIKNRLFVDNVDKKENGDRVINARYRDRLQGQIICDLAIKLHKRQTR